MNLFKHPCAAGCPEDTLLGFGNKSGTRFSIPKVIIGDCGMTLTHSTVEELSGAL